MRDAYERLLTFARDLLWSWLPDAAEFLSQLSPEGWKAARHNPVALLLDLGPAGAMQALAPHAARFEALWAAREAYLGATGKATWHARAGKPLQRPVAYFSAEFGLHECLPTYSGGLGILAGDHTKSASDLDVPFVGVGLLYRQGYVRQELGADGAQNNVYEDVDFERLPLTLGRAADGTELRALVEIDESAVHCRVWRAAVGRVELLLLDTDLPENAPEMRLITQRLYGGDHVTRIRQEIVLGIGGVRALSAAGYEPALFHLNEGHSAFLVLERARRLRATGAVATAAEAVLHGRATSVFTTHTPVEAGHDRFDAELVWRHLHRMADALGLDRAGLLAFGHWGGERDGNAMFNMTLLALHACGRANGVAALHGVVSRGMFERFFPGLPTDEVPITHVTNGVHAPTWQSPALRQLLTPLLAPVGRQPGGVSDAADTWPAESDPAWHRLRTIDDGELMALRRRLKSSLFAVVEARAAARAARLGQVYAPLDLDPDVLTIGFARRFAPYKRATLLFHDLERLKGILAAAPGPLQILFAGKAHPADEAGKRLVQQVFEASTSTPAKMVLVEGYDIDLGRALTQGVDVWLNNPRRPLEASGTSGMKAGMNGALNLSVLDGWWPEGYDGDNGWAIGEARAYDSETSQDAADAASLYHLLETEVLPLYYTRDANGLPREWLRRTKHAIATVTPRFSTDRQVQDYVHHMYSPA